MVLALPRGGVPVANEVARALHAPLDIFLVRKLGLPGHPELAMGAIASGGVRVLNDDVVAWYRVPDNVINVSDILRLVFDYNRSAGTGEGESATAQEAVSETTSPPVDESLLALLAAESVRTQRRRR